MSLRWNEIKIRTLAFAKERKDEVSEDAEAKSFWDEFFFELYPTSFSPSFSLFFYQKLLGPGQ
jgi:hypothetical protein